MKSRSGYALKIFPPPGTLGQLPKRINRNNWEMVRDRRKISTNHQFEVGVRLIIENICSSRRRLCSCRSESMRIIRKTRQMLKMETDYYEEVGFSLANEIIFSATGRFCHCLEDVTQAT
jgi:hypothetical protein